MEIKFLTSSTEEGAGIYRLDLNSFNGTLYNYESPSYQSVLIQFPLNYLHGIEYIRLFQEGFNVEDDPNEEKGNIYVYNLHM